MALTSPPGGTLEIQFDNGPAGLVGTLGVTVYDGQGGVVQARTTSGIVEQPAGSGMYIATIVAPTIPGTYQATADTGGGTPAFATETITVTISTVPSSGYVAIDAVAARDKGRRYTASSNPSISELDRWISLTAAELDGALRARGYVTPIPTTATAAWELLAGYNANGAIAYVEQSAVTGAGKKPDSWKIWQECLKAISAGTIELDAPKDLPTSRPRFRTAAGAGAPATALFRRDMDF